MYCRIVDAYVHMSDSNVDAECIIYIGALMCIHTINVSNPTYADNTYLFYHP